MSFWQTTNGKKVDGSAESSFLGDGFSPIPDGTTAPAMIQKFEKVSFESQFSGKQETHYQITWKLTAGDYAGRVIWQKLYVFDAKPDKADRAKNMMYRIFKLCHYTPSHNGEPTDVDLLNLVKKFAGIKIGQWGNIPGNEGKEGNKVLEVHALDEHFTIKTGVLIDYSKTKPLDAYASIGGGTCMVIDGTGAPIIGSHRTSSTPISDMAAASAQQLAGQPFDDDIPF